MYVLLVGFSLEVMCKIWKDFRQCVSKLLVSMGIIFLVYKYTCISVVEGYNDLTLYIDT